MCFISGWISFCLWGAFRPLLQNIINTGGPYKVLKAVFHTGKLFCVLTDQININLFSQQTSCSGVYLAVVYAERFITHFLFLKMKLNARHATAKAMPAAAKMEKMIVMGRATGITI